MKTSKIISKICFVLSFFSSLTYTISGAKVLENGVLKELFFLVPITLMFFIVGFIFLIVYRILKRRKKIKKT